jgi:hypothetical protein
MLILFIVAFLLIGAWFLLLENYNTSDDDGGMLDLPSRNELKRTTRNTTKDIEYPTWGRKDKD